MTSSAVRNLTAKPPLPRRQSLRSFCRTMTGIGVLSAAAAAKVAAQEQIFIIKEARPKTANGIIPCPREDLSPQQIRDILLDAHRLIDLKHTRAVEGGKDYGLVGTFLGALGALGLSFLSRKSDGETRRSFFKGALTAVGITVGGTTVGGIFGGVQGWNKAKTETHFVSELVDVHVTNLHAQERELKELIAAVVESLEFYDSVSTNRARFDLKDFAWFEQSLEGARSFLRDRSDGRRLDETKAVREKLESLIKSQSLLREQI